jgi:tagatose-1,6-bisphosphate aldolase
VGQQVIDVGSVTYAMKSRELLRSHGIRAYVERLPRAPEATGCGYGVYVPKDVEEAVRLLKEAGIHVLDVRERVTRE